MPRRPVFLIFLLSSCRDDNTIDSGEPAVPATGDQMPDRSGCTYTYGDDTDLDGVDGHLVSRSYDDQDRVSAATVTWADAYQIDESWTYDDQDCMLSYTQTITSLGEAYASYDGTYSWTASCDAQGTPIRRDGDYHGAPFEVVYTATYDGERLAALDAVTSWTDDGSATHTGWTYTYEADQLVREETTSEGVLSQVEEWTWLDALLVGYTVSYPLDPAESYAFSYGYDERSRVVASGYYTDEGELWSATFEWYDQIYQTRETRWSYISDDYNDEVQRWDCTEAWPWSCTGTTDGGLAPQDGTIDATAWLQWTCP